MTGATEPRDWIAPLFEPFALGKLTLPNRIVMAPMTRSFSPGGVPGEGVAGYYRRRAEGRVGLIVTEGVGVDQPASVGMGSMGEDHVPVLHGDAATSAWQQIVADVHAAGGLIVPQLWHMGVIRRPNTGPVPGAPSLRPSGLWGPQGRAMLPADYVEAMLPPTSPMTDAEISDTIAGFTRSAANAKALGFDGIAIHGAHGYLLDSFMWQETNRRDDAWGGDETRRSQFAAEVVRAIRAEIGPDLPIIYRFSQWKLQDYDARLVDTPEALERILAPVVEAGIDLIEASTRVYDQPAFADSDLTLAGWAKKLTGVPSMAVGGVGLNKDLQTSFTDVTVGIDNLRGVADRIARGEFDLIAVGRSLLIDPQWAIKARDGTPFEPFSLEALGSLS